MQAGFQPRALATCAIYLADFCGFKLPKKLILLIESDEIVQTLQMPILERKSVLH